MALADNENVTIYGTLNMDYESAHNDNNTAFNSQRLSTSSSNLGFKGKEDLGDGLKAFYQLESQLDMTGAGNAGLFNGARNSAIGLESSFGTFFMGIWETPFRLSHNKVELFGNTTSFSSTNIIGQESLSGAKFVTRKSSIVQYWSPKFDGFQAKLSYSPEATTTTKKTEWSFSAEYENDMLYATYAYDSKKNQKSTVADLTNTANRVVGAYKFKDGQVGLTYERLSVAQAAGSTSTASRNAWELSGKYKAGNSNFGGFYTRAGDLSGTAESGAKQFALRYGYNLSKRTELWSAYTKLDNDTNAKYAFAHNAFGTATANATLSALGVGMIHKF
ncbi:MAG: hypothetical protein A2Z95_07655 [Gallionellales bacterium GWA2_60_18]|nr:MAG: hypothetical protein A2Z95_07655 [Gallionellales bacterium GWA2_60_18]